MRRVIVVLAALVVSACQTISNPVSPTNVFQLESAYGVVQSAARAYAHLPRCSVHAAPCATQANIAKLSNVDHAARSALNKLEAFVRANPKVSALSLLTAANDAIASAKSVARAVGAL